MSTWVTKDGRILDMSEMTDSHLANAKAMLQRRIDKDLLMDYKFFTDVDPGDVTVSTERMLSKIDELRIEMERRTLNA